MKFQPLACLLCAAILAIPATTFADSDDTMFVSGMMSYYDDDVDRNTDDDVSAGRLGFGLILSDNWNAEAMLGLNDSAGLIPQKQYEYGIDLQRVFNRDGTMSPYLFVGLSRLDVNFKDQPGDNESAALGAGLGFLAKVFDDQSMALRGEYRYRADDSNFNDQFISFGLQKSFGGSPSIPTPPPEPVDPDSDGDGVPDSRDRCMSTPAGVKVDANGCPLDGDGDGVADFKDKCPKTVRGAKVDANGCEMDADKDGVVDRLDRCPNTREGAQVDVAGCEIKEEIKLPGVNFESNRATLLPGAETVLNNAAETLKRNPEIKVEVAGHTDSDGAAEYNQSLSARRAETVRAYLEARGVAADRMTTRGYGEAEPIADNSTATGKAQNRRVVLRVTER